MIMLHILLFIHQLKRIVWFKQRELLNSLWVLLEVFGLYHIDVRKNWDVGFKMSERGEYTCKNENIKEKNLI